MRMNSFVVLIVIVAVLFAMFLWTGVFPIWAQGDAGVLFKLNKILENQNRMIGLLNEIKSDLANTKSKQ